MRSHPKITYSEWHLIHLLILPVLILKNFKIFGIILVNFPKLYLLNKCQSLFFPKEIFFLIFFVPPQKKEQKMQTGS